MPVGACDLYMFDAVYSVTSVIEQPHASYNNAKASFACASSCFMSSASKICKNVVDIHVEWLPYLAFVHS